MITFVPQIVMPLSSSWAPLVSFPSTSDAIRATSATAVPRLITANSASATFRRCPIRSRKRGRVPGERDEQDRLRHDRDRPHPPVELPELPVALHADEREAELQRDDSEDGGSRLPSPLDRLFPGSQFGGHPGIFPDQEKSRRTRLRLPVQSALRRGKGCGPPSLCENVIGQGGRGTSLDRVNRSSEPPTQ